MILLRFNNWCIRSHLYFLLYLSLSIKDTHNTMYWIWRDFRADYVWNTPICYSSICHFLKSINICPVSIPPMQIRFQCCVSDFCIRNLLLTFSSIYRYNFLVEFIYVFWRLPLGMNGFEAHLEWFVFYISNWKTYILLVHSYIIELH